MPAHPTWFEPKMPDAAECSIRLLLEAGAQAHPDRLFAVFEDDRQWSWQETLAQARAAAAGLQALGVGRGDLVLAWLPNGPAMLRCWFAINYLGAVFVPLNVAYRGGILTQAIGNTRARLMLAHAALVPRLAEIDRPSLQRVVVFGGDVAPIPGLTLLPAEALDGDPATVDPGAPPAPWEIAAVVHTSGTTGPSKGVLAPYAQLWTVARAHFGYMTPADRMLLMTPLAHISPISGVMAALVQGACVVVQERFRTEAFWDTVRHYQVTTVPGMGPAIMDFLMKAPPQPDDRENPLRMVNVRCANDTVIAFARRFGVNYFGSFSMSETSVVTIQEVNAPVRESCGRPRDGVEVRLVDAHDIEVPVGAVGEIILRADHPWVLNAGYLNAPEATAQAWRNGWFHTGDAARCDAEGNFFFLDRLKDAIRRRGENISSIEIEQEVLAHPAVQDAAAIGVPSQQGDHEVLLAVSPRPGRTIEPDALLAFLIPRMAHFMVPRFVRVLPELPRTLSNKVQKNGLRQEGVTSDTWDREVEGLHVRSERLGPV
jgi:crotonobetaine/carnitine-CoA ligase